MSNSAHTPAHTPHSLTSLTRIYHKLLANVVRFLFVHTPTHTCADTHAHAHEKTEENPLRILAIFLHFHVVLSSGNSTTTAGNKQQIALIVQFTHLPVCHL